MKMYEVSKFVTSNPEAIVQFMTTSSFLDRPFTYCCTVQELYDDWMDEANHCPENGDMILICTFYVDGKAYPIESAGLDECNDFENLMNKIKSGFRNLDFYLSDINIGMMTETARVSCIWDNEGQWVDMNYSFDDKLGYGEYQTCFAELYDSGNPTEETWKTAQAIATYIADEYGVDIDIKDECEVK